jgi:hypothetical protein
MEQNLPYVSVGLIDDQYNNRVLPFLGKIDSGHLFKWFIVLFWKLTSYVFLIGGLWITIMSMTGKKGYIKSTLGQEGITGAQYTGGIIGLILGVIISIVCAWFLYSITKKRAEQLNDEAYHGVLHFISHCFAPRAITLTGELAFTLIFYVSLLQLIASLDGYAAYAPLMDYMSVFLSLPVPGMDLVSGFVPTVIQGDYDFMDVTLRLAIGGMAAAFVVLIAYYAIREIYMYGLKITMNLLAFIPKFAIPVAIRNRQE